MADITIYNISFLVEEADRERFLAWLRSTLATLPAEGYSAQRILELADTPGMPREEGMPLSIALHTEFDAPEVPDSWILDAATPLLASYSDTFGDKAIYFPSILKSLPLL